ncbi:dual specificity protein phosphatase 18 [Hemicordylus capensis]|uniref:dual specificity protein phosphatase 18 n=1 Tax=Hemicordylus capensis TaxID=884348 RepID=UPI0023023D36|nr:dual specificity protein phosphatase 18 [Hemicordylus capensis]XP_053135599.1 dual specificity protein phosphatase 18 [Hemicordylus capensis]XP_053135600.1 dual specificity protein phosphatase 18 [Hemicordylus capensis]
MTTAFTSIPVLFRNPPVYGLSRITNSLFISNGEAANNKVFLYANQITTVINVSVEVVNTYFPDIYYIHVPVTDSPHSRLYDFFDPVADKIRNVELNQGRTLVHCAAGVSRSAALGIAYLMKYHSMTLANAHAWTKSCRPIIRPNNGFWQQLIQYEYKLFGKTSVKMVQSPLGVIPDLYENEIQVMVAL